MFQRSLRFQEIENITLWLFAGLLFALTALVCFGAGRSGGVDELGLYNPIYMYLHTGRMTYPIHGQFDFMVVHPPLHYLIIAWFMKFGLGFYYAEQMPIFLMMGICLLLIVKGKFPAFVKIGLLSGTFVGSFLILCFSNCLLFSVRPESSLTFSVRPDLMLALSWAAGLIALESGRLDNWNPKLLFLGSLLLTFASGLHYYGALAFLGVVVYVVWGIWELGWKKARSSLLAIVLGGCLIGVPYLLLFIIPNWNNIRDMVRSVQQGGGIWEAIARHFQAYEYWANSCKSLSSDGGNNLSIIRWLTSSSLNCFLASPIWALKIPAIIVSTSLLIIFRATRGIALASLPLTLMVFLYSQGKSSGYYLPEFIVYIAAVVTAGFAGILWILNRLSWIRFGKILPLLTISTLAIILSVQFLKLNSPLLLKPRVHEMEIARAANRDILGSTPVVGGRIGPWYVSGASHWYDVAPDLIWRDPPRDLKSYFSAFDAVLENGHMSNSTSNSRKEVLSSWYLDKTLQLKSFYLSGSDSLTISHLLLTARDKSPIVKGYVYRDFRLHQFQESSAGDYVFATMKCPSSQVGSAQAIGAEVYTHWPLPIVGTEPPNVLAFAIFRRDSYRFEEIQKSCIIRDEVPGTLSEVDQKVLLGKLHRNDPTMRFYPTFEELRAVQAFKSNSEAIYTAEHHWQEWLVFNPLTRLKLKDNGSVAWVRTNQSLNDPQIISPFIKVKPNSSYLIETSIQVEEGGVWLNVQDKKNNPIFTRKWCEQKPGEVLETKFVVDTNDSDQISFLVNNCRQWKPKRSKFKLRSLKVWPAKMNYSA